MSCGGGERESEAISKKWTSCWSSSSSRWCWCWCMFIFISFEYRGIETLCLKSWIMDILSVSKHIDRCTDTHCAKSLFIKFRILPCPLLPRVLVVRVVRTEYAEQFIVCCLDWRYHCHNHFSSYKSLTDSFWHFSQFISRWRLSATICSKSANSKTYQTSKWINKRKRARRGEWVKEEQTTLALKRMRWCIRDVGFILVW